MRFTVIPDGIGVGTIEIGDRRYALLRIETGDSGDLPGSSIDVPVSFSDLGALVAEGSELRSREASRA